jgi:tellurite methyltransferase
MVDKEPFWESSYRSNEQSSTFGAPSSEIVELAGVMPEPADVLDLGCGDGRNALYLAEQGHLVTAVDVSEAAIHKLSRSAQEASISINAEIQDMRRYDFQQDFDLIIAHGSLHLIPRPDWATLIARIKKHTRAGGHNIVAVFTDVLPPPEDLKPFQVGLFREHELFEQYRDWEILLARSYVLEDSHPGGIHHRHPINKLVARRLV